MKSIHRLSTFPAGTPLVSDELVEFHAARILLLLTYCGVKNRGITYRIEGLTKLAKLDFFVRYPDFFNQASQAMNMPESSKIKTVESSMVRYHYGPWDKRYYDILGYLESRSLLKIYKSGSALIFETTDLGQEMVNKLKDSTQFDEIILQMKQVKKVFGSKSGNTLKKLIYELFKDEVTDKSMGELI